MAREDDDPVRVQLDRLAGALGRSVSIDDPEGGLLGYSVQADDADEARIAAILSRRVPAAVQRWQDEQGVRAATEPLRLPANPDLGMAERLCVPIWDGDVVLGQVHQRVRRSPADPISTWSTYLPLRPPLAIVVDAGAPRRQERR